MLIQIIVILFSLFAIYKTLIRRKKEEITTAESIIWVLLWLAVGTAVIIPKTTDQIGQFVGVSRGVDLLVYLSIIVMFFIIFKVIVKLEKIERNVTKVVRHLSLKDIDEDDEN